jgi:hypothetical protein
MAVSIQSQIFNPITGVFGTGQMQIFGPGMSGSWTVPIGIGKCRVRMFGGGGTVGGGGGFSLKSIYDLTGVTSVPVIVGGAGGTSSFGSYCSATGGGGVGVGGDINTSGGAGTGGGVGSLFGNGSGNGTSIGVSGSNTFASGLFGSGSYVPSTNFSTPANSGMVSPFSIDLFGTGAGSVSSSTAFGQGVNGGGGYNGSFPGGGGASGSGAPGMVIVEW